MFSYPPWVRTATLTVCPVPFGKFTCNHLSTISNLLDTSNFCEQTVNHSPRSHTVALNCWSLYLGSMLSRKWASADSTNLVLAVCFSSATAVGTSYSFLFSLSFCISKNLFDRVCSPEQTQLPETTSPIPLHITRYPESGEITGYLHTTNAPQ